MALHSVEGLLDAATDAEVRREWAVLAEVQLPSQAGHKGPTNAPHVTLSAAGHVPDEAEDRLHGALPGMLPVPVRLGPLVVMGSRRHVLARLVVPSAALLALHRAVAEAMTGASDVSELVRVDRWTPHVTLAHGLTAEQVGQALAVLGPLRGLDGAIETVRRWDPGARRTWPVGGIPTMGP
ncbi:2'-5' RNA ligase family protein [Terrabacter sp. NPDC080008]|uniref:2'-5' RNA ligase family protein n=1 Tax=Terrabacter sp. NPDC080008 TaxID=3155176 RepID=UPI00344F4643